MTQILIYFVILSAGVCLGLMIAAFLFTVKQSREQIDAAYVDEPGGFDKRV